MCNTLMASVILNAAILSLSVATTKPTMLPMCLEKSYKTKCFLDDDL